MNKTFKDPNTKYSDQGTPLSQAKSVADSIASLDDSIASVEETVSGLADTVDGLSEKVILFPVPVVADEGKVLTATDDGAYELADVDALPTISAGDAGKVLTVNAGETGAEWAEPSGSASVVYIDLGTSTSAINSTPQYITSTKINSTILDNMLAHGIIPIFGVVNKNNGSKPFIFTPTELSGSQSARRFICAMPIYKTGTYAEVRQYELNVTSSGFSLVQDSCFINGAAQYYQAPTGSDGTYTLKLTKSGYTYSYAWVQDT